MPFDQLDPTILKKLADTLKRARAQAVGLGSGPEQPPDMVGFFFQPDTDDDLWTTLSGHCQAYLELSAEEERFLAAVSAIQAENRRLRQQTVIDRGSGLYTRTYFLEALEIETARMARFNRPLSLLLIKLKGPGPNGPGSLVFKAAARLILKRRRRLDQAARYRRDTLALIMPDTALRQALTAARRLRAMITAAWEELILPPAGPASERGEVLLGLAETAPGQAKEARRLLADAQEALKLAAWHDGIWPDWLPEEPENGTTVEPSEKEALFAGFRELTELL